MNSRRENINRCRAVYENPPQVFDKGLSLSLSLSPSCASRFDRELLPAYARARIDRQDDLIEATCLNEAHLSRYLSRHWLNILLAL